MGAATHKPMKDSQVSGVGPIRFESVRDMTQEGDESDSAISFLTYQRAYLIDYVRPDSSYVFTLITKS